MNIEPLTLVILGLATWRISSLLVDEEGPFSIFMKFRMAIGTIYYVDEDILTNDQAIELSKHNFELTKNYQNEFAKLFSCVWCLSIWIAPLFFTANELLKGDAYTAFRWLSICLALSTLAIIIDCFTTE